MVPVNVCLRTMRGPYVRSFDGFDRPWRHLEQVTENVRVRELGLGAGYIMTGRVPAAGPPSASGGPGSQGRSGGGLDAL
jgi:hypothetical protein